MKLDFFEKGYSFERAKLVTNDDDKSEQEKQA
jgi:hypothetical protein